MIRVLIILLFILCSCGYPDIDSVPDFNNMNITKEESIDLCKLSNLNDKDLSECLKKVDKTYE